jgi:hypothetical protein
LECDLNPHQINYHVYKSSVILGDLKLKPQIDSIEKIISNETYTYNRPIFFKYSIENHGGFSNAKSVKLLYYHMMM